MTTVVAVEALASCPMTPSHSSTQAAGASEMSRPVPAVHNPLAEEQTTIRQCEYRGIVITQIGAS